MKNEKVNLLVKKGLLCALSLVLMLLVFVCTGIMNKFADDEEGGVLV